MQNIIKSAYELEFAYCFFVNFTYANFFLSSIS